jgi:hypothetical protein
LARHLLFVISPRRFEAAFKVAVAARSPDHSRDRYPQKWGDVSQDSWILLDNACPTYLRHNVLVVSEGRTENKIDMKRWVVG